MKTRPMLFLVTFGVCQNAEVQANLVVLNPVHSGHVQSNNSGSFYQLSDIAVKHDPGSIYTRVGYLKFDLSSITNPIVDVSLSFESAGGIAGSVTNGSFVYDFNVWALNDGHANENWSPPIAFEDGIGLDPANHLVDSTEATSVAAFQQTGTGTSGDLFDLNTAQLMSATTGDTNGMLTLMIFRTQNANNGNIVHGFVRDSFALNITTAPEPSTGIFFFIGLAAVGSRRRRTSPHSAFESRKSN